MIRKYKNAFLRFYRIYTEMALPESNASAYSAISANIKFIGQPRPRDSCGYPKFSSAWSADQISTAAPLLCSLYLPQAALTGKLPIPPYPQILNLSGNRARVTLAVIRNFLRLGAPIKFRPLRLCSVRCICHKQRSQANCLFHHTRILSFHPLNFTRRGLSEAERFA